jgi:3-hydroxyisobutyrate dehydrogenase-like beta-hydroxyacid dehydrogenase
MAKDLSYAVGEASVRNIFLGTAAAAASMFQRAVAEGHGDEDFSAITKVS